VVLKRGQAYFQVAKDASRPFVVQTTHRRVVALGTAFDVEYNAGLFQVLLVEGSVQVDHGGHSLSVPGESASAVVLNPGQALVARLGVEERVVILDVERRLRWREGFVEFEDEPLASAVAELNRYYASPVVIRDARVAQLRVSGIFRTTPRDEFVSLVGELLPVRVNRLQGGSVELAWSATH
jgi:transmembrane sensor